MTGPRCLYLLAFFAFACAEKPPDDLSVNSSALGTQYYVDPAVGQDVPSGGTLAIPWRSVEYATTRIGTAPDAVLNLKSGFLYGPFALGWPFISTFKGTAGHPITIQPYGGPSVTFDAGLPEFRQPNNLWEVVPALEGGVPGEWRTKNTYVAAATSKIWYGQIMASKHRLLSYQELDDLRASNESYAVVHTTDPRTSLGPIASAPNWKVPTVYRGPGIAFEYVTATEGRIHIRLTATHFATPGIADYSGESNPNLVALSITRSDRYAAESSSEYITFRNVVFQNAGTTLLGIAGSHVSFDHCEFYPSRTGVKIAAGTSHLTFDNCLFDGGVAPWTTRADLKDTYDYLPPGCPDASCKLTNNAATRTSDMLVISPTNDSVYNHCTFRHAHDALQITGQRNEVKSCLFEDINDEAIQFGPLQTAIGETKVHENMFRQTLHPFSFALNPSGVGPLNIYRNIIDQRIPIRGTRVLFPDVDMPSVWRYGSDIKNGTMPALAIYQNTFISSHDLDKTAWITPLFKTAGTQARWYLNNIHLSLNIDRAISELPAYSALNSTAGNVWYRFQNPTSTLIATSNSFQALHSVRPDWEVGSLYADPQLANFSDEYFEFAAPYPNTDYRPLANVGGLPLPPNLPDVAAYSGIVHAGALPANAPPFAVGVDSSTVQPAAGFPVARAGSDVELNDTNGDGFETILIDGSGSTTQAGVLQYSWQRNGVQVASTATASLLLPVGKHVVRLLVTNSAGFTDSDAIVVTITTQLPNDNLLENPGFEAGLQGWLTSPPSAAQADPTVSAHSGARSLKLSNTGAQNETWQRVQPLAAGVTYRVSTWAKTNGLAMLIIRTRGFTGAILTEQIIDVPPSQWSYLEGTVISSANTYMVEVALQVGGGSTAPAWFDDVRILETNGFMNPGFETRSPTGVATEVPGWKIQRGDGRIDRMGPSHRGTASLVLEVFSVPNYTLVSQTIVHVPGRRYRIGGWAKIDSGVPVTTATVRRFNAAGANAGTIPIPISLTSGNYAWFERTLELADLPANTAKFDLELRVDQVGRTRFDDLYLAILP